MSAVLTLRTLSGGTGNTTKGARLTPEEMDANFINLDNEIDSKASKVSPALTGTPTTPTAPIGTNTTQIASTAFVKSTIDANDPIQWAIVFG